MGTDLKSSTQDISLVRIWGGKEQKMQVTMPRPEHERELTTADVFFTSIQLTRDEAKTLALDLLRFSEHQEIEE